MRPFPAAPARGHLNVSEGKWFSKEIVTHLYGDGVGVVRPIQTFGDSKLDSDNIRVIKLHAMSEFSAVIFWGQLWPATIMPGQA